nr:hypothetical protein [Tanacetum cinerariifolium]
RRSAQKGTKAPKAGIDEGMVVAEDLHLLRDSSKDDSEEESPAEDSDVVGGYMVENEADL